MNSVANGNANKRLDPGIRLRLSIMMFLQYFAWGAWFVTMGNYIGTHKEVFEVGFTGPAYATTAIAAIIAPFFVGMVADRFFSTERILFVLHLIGGGALYYLSQVDDQGVFYALLLVFFLCYMPTLALTNSLSFHHLPDPSRQFPGIRVLGTIGWIAAGLLVGYLVMNANGQISGWALKFGGQGAEPSLVIGEYDEAMSGIEGTTLPMIIGAIAQGVLAVFCLLLPHTPPSKREGKITASDILGLDALKLMRRWGFAVFVVGSFLVTIPLQFYYSYTNFFLNNIGVPNPAGKMTYGQMSEIFFMLLMPFFFARLGVKYMLLVGMLSWAVRYFLFAFGDADPNMWMLYIGIILHGICYDFFFVTGQIYVDEEAEPRIRGAAQGFLTFVTLGLGAFIGNNLAGLAEKATTTPSGEHDWQTFWLYPAIGATAIMVLFALTFHDDKHKRLAKS